MTTIDVHAHLYDRGYLSELTGLLSDPRTDAERASAALLARIKADPRCCEVIERVELMQRIGLDYQVLSLSIPFSYDGDKAARARLARVSNDCVADAVRDYPKRFVALATLPLPEVDASLRVAPKQTPAHHFRPRALRNGSTPADGRLQRNALARRATVALACWVRTLD